MDKKSIYIKLMILTILIIFFNLFINISNAVNETNIYLKPNKDIFEKEEIIEITLYMESNEVASFNTELNFDNTKLEYIKETEKSNLIDNKVIYLWYDETGGQKPKTGELVTFKFKVKNTGIATFTIDGEFYNKEGQNIDTKFEGCQIQIGKEQAKLEEQAKNVQNTDISKENAKLQILRINNLGITPAFDRNIFNYYLTVSNNISEIEVLAIAENSKATVEITGNTNLKEGLNVIDIKVISEDKTKTNNYTIEVTKTSNIELANTNLEILAIENILLNPPFDENITNYSVEVSNEENTLNIFAVPQNENAKVQINGQNDIKEGKNQVEVIVTAGNGFSKKIYKIEVYKRNKEEQVKYEEQQEENQQELENAYKIEETSSQNKEIQQSQNISQTENKLGKNTVIGIIVIVVIILFIFVIWRRKNI